MLILTALLAVTVGLHQLMLPPSQVQPAEPKQPGPSLVKGVWLNYMEYAAMMDGKTRQEYEKQVEQLLNNMEEIGLNTLFLHVRSHSDSLYPSDIFPWSVHINGGRGVAYDNLTYLLEQAHSRSIGVHAWINPYRISAGSPDALRENDPAYGMRQDSNRVVAIDSGVYYNPSSPQVRALVLSGVRELLDRYPFDGVQYDDYFYPTADASFDRVAYNQYCDATDAPLSLGDWRRGQVNLLIAGTYQLTRQYEGVAFGISPAADIRRNYEEYYADIAAWVAGGYVDYLCPQLYFGFGYPAEEFRFDALLAAWKTLAKDTPLYIGLASYKVGTTDAGSDEWVTCTDLLARETDYAAGCAGICMYHYSSLIKDDALSAVQRENLKEALARFS